MGSSVTGNQPTKAAASARKSLANPAYAKFQHELNWKAKVAMDTYIYVYIHIYIYMYMCICIYMYIRINIYIYAHKHMYTYIYMHTYKCTYMYIVLSPWSHGLEFLTLELRHSKTVAAWFHQHLSRCLGIKASCYSRITSPRGPSTRGLEFRALRVQIPNGLGTLVLGNSNSSRGFRQVYDFWVLGPLG